MARKQKWRIPKRRGQALAEFTAAVVLIMTMFAGLIQISTLSQQSTKNLMEARGAADDGSTNPLSSGVGDDYIADWEVGPDGLRYTADDIPKNGSDFLDVYSNELSSPVPVTDLVTDDTKDEYQFLLSLNSIVEAADLRRGRRTASVPVEPALKPLIGSQNTFFIEDEVFMPLLELMGGNPQ